MEDPEVLTTQVSSHFFLVFNHKIPVTLEWCEQVFAIKSLYYDYHSLSTFFNSVANEQIWPNKSNKFMMDKSKSKSDKSWITSVVCILLSNRSIK